MNIRFTSAAGSFSDPDAYNLPQNFVYDDREINANAEVSDNAFKDGGTVVGNLRLQSREIEITGIFSTDTEDANEKINNFLAYVKNNQPLKMFVVGESDLNPKYLTGIYWKNSSIRDKIYKKTVEKTISLIVEYPFWIFQTENSIEQTLNSGDILTLTNTSKFDVSPSFEFLNETGSNPSFYIKNVETNRAFRISEPFFTSGQTIYLDARAGTLIKNNATILQYFSGTMIKLQSGTNNLFYYGLTPLKIKVKWNNEELR